MSLNGLIEDSSEEEEFSRCLLFLFFNVSDSEFKSDVSSAFLHLFLAIM